MEVTESGEPVSTSSTHQKQKGSSSSESTGVPAAKHISTQGKSSKSATIRTLLQNVPSFDFDSGLMTLPKIPSSQSGTAPSGGAHNPASSSGVAVQPQVDQLPFLLAYDLNAMWDI